MKKISELRFGDEVPVGAVETGDIADGAVTAEKLGAGAAKVPAYDGQNHEFLDAGAEGSAIYGFKDKDAAHRWTASRGCVVYVRVAGTGSGRSVVYVHVNSQDAPTDDTSRLLFKQAFVDGAGTAVPVFLNAGDSLDLRVADNSLSQLQYSVFYTD